MKSFGLFLLFVFITFVLSACGASAPSTPPQSSVTQGPVTEAPVATEGPVTGDLPTATALSQSLSKEEQLAQVDDILKQATKASIAYNAPSAMHMDETVTIELLLDPRLSEEKLKEQISEPGAVRTRGMCRSPHSWRRN